MPKLASSQSKKSIAITGRRLLDKLSPLIKIFISLSIICFSFLLGCRSAAIWSGESKSPDGKTIATASTFQDAGFLAGETQTTVYLNWAIRSQSKTLILAYSDGPTAQDMGVQMRWLTPTHLELTYSGQRSLDFQAVRCNGIDITVRNVPNGTISAVQ